jgi:hypothetical protein
MKQLCAFLLVIFVSDFSFAQTQANKDLFPKTISVTGKAEMEIVPDEIYVQVDLREYKKKGEEKILLETIKAEFLRHCKSIGLPDSAITIASYEGVNADDWWRKRKRDPLLLSSISYQILFKDAAKMEDLVEKLDEEATANFRIVRTWHTRMTEYRKQLKIAAIKSAKEKGLYLTEAIGEKLGQAITIQEGTAPDIVTSPRSNAASNVVAFEDKNYAGAYSNVRFKTIKLEYTVAVIYSLQ